jgi:hypothetical protein
MGRHGSPGAVVAVAGLAAQVVQGIEFAGIRLGWTNYPTEKRAHPPAAISFFEWDSVREKCTITNFT